MAKSKLTLIVDGNWLLMSRLRVLENRYLDDYELCHELQLMMIKSINVVLRTFPSIDNIIFVADGGSWRNNIEIPSCLHHEIAGKDVEYKGNREKSEDINWDLIFSSYEEFLSLLNSCGITACREKNIEGDDWCCHWSTYLNDNNTNCIIWTKDNDLKQLVKINKDKCFTVWWNKDSGLFTPIYEENDMNFLFNNALYDNEAILNEIISKSISTTQINPNTIIIDKIIRGDSGDNIFPVIVKKTQGSSGRLYRVNVKDLDFNLNYNNEQSIKEYFVNLLNSKKYSGKIDKSLDDIVEHFKYNKKLIVLNKDNYPQEVVDILDSYDTYNISKDTMTVESYIQASSNKLQNILDII